MPQNFIACDRGQTMLMPADLTDWVPDDHVVWSILGAGEQMDLSAFYGVYREKRSGARGVRAVDDGRTALYSYARGNRSSRGIERACREDVTYKLITGMAIPDHSTIAEFRRPHEKALGELFTAVLSVCREAGLAEVGVISIDGVKARVNASPGANRGYEKLVADILKEAEGTDRWEDGLFGDPGCWRLRPGFGRLAGVTLRDHLRRPFPVPRSPPARPALLPSAQSPRRVGAWRRG
jgi:transposase